MLVFVVKIERKKKMCDTSFSFLITSLEKTSSNGELCNEINPKKYMLVMF